MRLLNRMPLLLWVCFFSVVIGVSVSAAEEIDTTLVPALNKREKWGIGYHGTINRDQLVGLADALMDMDWIERAEIPPQESGQALWHWLSKEARSRYLHFAKAPYTVPEKETDEKNDAVESLKRLGRQEKAIHCVVTTDFNAAQKLAKNRRHSIPTLLLVSSDHIREQKSVIRQNMLPSHIRLINPFDERRQLSVFRKLFKFKTLGIIYRDDLMGSGSIAEMARKEKFEVLSCFVTPASETSPQEIIPCFRKLVKKADALYITAQANVNKDSLSELVAIAHKAKRPTFSQTGATELQAGLLLGLSPGRFYAEALAKMLHSIKADKQGADVNPERPKILINVKTAKIIGYDPPVEVLGAADDIYEDIIPPE